MMKKIISAIMVLALVLMLFGCSKNESITEETSEAESVFFSAAKADKITDYDTDTDITLNSSTAVITGDGASFTNGDLKITSGGSYGITGNLSDGRIVVDAKGQDVTLVFGGVNISCSDSAAVLVYNSSLTTLIAAADTGNTFTDGNSYVYTDSYSNAAEEEPNACIYSKSDLVIGGDGAFIINGNMNNGITSKDTLTVSYTTIGVNAVNNGINGKDSAVITGSDIEIVSSGDGLRSTNDTDSSLGYIDISDSNLTILSGEDGIQAEQGVTIESGTFNITSGGGCNAVLGADVSAKGIKSGASLSIGGGTFIIDSCDDAFHSGGDQTVKGGTFTIKTGDDGMHSDTSMNISGGDINITQSYEGIEGTSINISGGNIHVNSSDDGINAAGGADSSGFGNMDAGMSFGGGTSSVEISGGNTVINSDGDGLDSNGSVTMTGGTVIIYGPTNSGNGALDYDSTFEITGGTLVAEGSSGMAQSPNSASEYGMSVTFTQSLQAGTYICISDSSEQFIFKVQKTMNNLVFVSPELDGGSTYTVSYGGSCSGGTDSDGIISGGTYSDGTTLTDITMSDYINAYGSVGVGGSMGGGRMNGGGWGGRPGM